MADTEDVAKVLFEFLTGFPYSKHLDHYVNPEQMVEDLETLANECGIGIEVARRLLWVDQHGDDI